MVRALARGVQGLALLLPVAGCVLVVPAIEPKASCAIAGGTPCATCLRSSCQAPIDTCCGDPSCSGSDGHSEVLDAVDACGNGDKDACATSLQVAGSGAAGAIRSCIRQSCNDACLAGATIAVKWTCDSPRAEESACARCIYRSCASRLDACCADSACSKSSVVQADMSACVSGDEAGCAYSRTRYDSGLDGALRTCVADQCFTSCMGDGRPHASCQLYSGGGVLLLLRRGGVRGTGVLDRRRRGEELRRREEGLHLRELHVRRRSVQGLVLVRVPRGIRRELVPGAGHRRRSLLPEARGPRCELPVRRSRDRVQRFHGRVRDRLL